MSLEGNPLYEFAKIMMPKADEVYAHLWPGCLVERYSDKQRGVHVLDQHFGIDVLIKLPSGLLLTVQEKFRQHDNLRFDDFTLEYYNDPRTKEEGEWFHLCADLYFYGYANREQTGWLAWRLFKVIDLKLAIANGEVVMGGPIPNKRSRANFMNLRWPKVPKGWYVESHDQTAAGQTGRWPLFDARGWQ